MISQEIPDASAVLKRLFFLKRRENIDNTLWKRQPTRANVKPPYPHPGRTLVPQIATLQKKFPSGTLPPTVRTGSIEDVLDLDLKPSHIATL